MAPIFRDIPTMRTVLTPPSVWALHFLVCYVAAAVHCAKAGDRMAGLGPVQTAIAGATVVALALIGLATWQALGHWGFRTATPPHNADSRDERRRFIGFATLLLCGVSAVGVVFVALPAVFIGDCR